MNTKRRIQVFFSLALLLCCVTLFGAYPQALAQNPAPAVSATPSKTELDIFAVLKNAGMFSIFLEAVGKAGLPESLQNEKPIVLLAPRDEDFAKLDPKMAEALKHPDNHDKLVQLMSYHVIKAPWPDEIGRNSLKIETLSGDPISVRLKSRKLSLNEKARLIKGDIAAKNGTIYVIDRVLIPPDFEVSLPQAPADEEPTADTGKAKPDAS